jgi:hypothetical protein
LLKSFTNRAVIELQRPPIIIRIGWQQSQARVVRPKADQYFTLLTPRVENGSNDLRVNASTKIEQIIERLSDDSPSRIDRVITEYFPADVSAI